MFALTGLALTKVLCFLIFQGDNAISEKTEIIHLTPITEYVGKKEDRQVDFCDRSCDELGTMFTELSGLRVIVNNLLENLQKVVSLIYNRLTYIIV